MYFLFLYVWNSKNCAFRSPVGEGKSIFGQKVKDKCLKKQQNKTQFWNIKQTSGISSGSGSGSGSDETNSGSTGISTIGSGWKVGRRLNIQVL